MKKFLLYAAAAVIASSASAQKLETRKVAQSMKSNTAFMQATTASKLQKSAIKEANSAFAKLDKTPKAMSRKFVMPKSELSSATASAQLKSMQKVGAVQELYTGYGTDTQDGAVTWNMFSGTGTMEDGTTVNLLADIIPNFTSLDYIAVEYVQNGNTITIPFQPVFRTASYYAYVMNEYGEDITMTLEEDGSLTLPAGSAIIYGAFTTQVSSFNSASYAGGFSIVENITYCLPGQIPPPTTEYVPQGLYLHPGSSVSGYGYNNDLAMIPAYAPVSFKNYTTGVADSYQWVAAKYGNTPEETDTVAVARTTDFTFNTVPGVYKPVELTAYNEANSVAYSWGIGRNSTNGYVYAGADGSTYVYDDGTEAVISKADMNNNGLTLYRYLATPDVNSNNYSLSDLVLYQGKPSAPLYAEGINMLVYNFEDKGGFNLTCQIRKVSKNSSGWLELGDIIAESNITSADVVVDENWAELRFTDFYVYDEDGMTVGIDHMFLDEEFAVVLTGWDNGTFSCIPIGEYAYNVSGETSTYCINTGDTELLRFSSLYSCLSVGFINAAYGYLYTEDNLNNVTLGDNGSSARVTINPMMCTVNDEDNKLVTRLFLDDDVEIPEWLDFTIENENYEDEYQFDLVFTAIEDMPADVYVRSAVLRFWQEGAYIDVTVSQVNSDPTGIGNVKVEAVKNGETFNVAGQKVSDNAKGLIIRDGKKFIK